LLELDMELVKCDSPPMIIIVVRGFFDEAG